MATGGGAPETDASLNITITLKSDDKHGFVLLLCYLGDVCHRQVRFLNSKTEFLICKRRTLSHSWGDDDFHPPRVSLSPSTDQNTGDSCCRQTPGGWVFLRQEKNMLKCSASREVPTYQLHPEFPRPLQAHCRAERGTGSCARKSHGDASSPVRKGDSSGSAIFAAGKSCVPYQAPLTDTNFQNKMGKMLWNVWPERSPLFFLSSHPLFSNFKTRFKPPTVRL